MKKYIAVVFYADDARFFINISEHFKLDLTVLCIYPSAYVYCQCRRVKSIFISDTSGKRKKPFNSDFLDHYKEFVFYEKQLGLFHQTEKTLKYLANIYEKINSVLKKENYELAFLSGDTRFIIKIFEFLAKKQSLRILYFEQGPFGTTILDEKGVNANCSFRENWNSTNSQMEQEIIISKAEKCKYIRYFRIFDFIFLPIKRQRFQLLDNTSSIQLKIKKSHKITRSFTDLVKNGKKYALLILQVPVDANFIYHSPYFQSHIEIVNKVQESLPKDLNLVIREHPLYKNQYEEELYQYCLENSISFNNEKLQMVFKNVEVVIVNNSTVGIEALEQGLPLVCLGNSYYDILSDVYKYKGNNLKELLVQAFNNTNEKKREYKTFKSYLYERELINFHFRDKNYIFNNPNLKRKIYV